MGREYNLDKKAVLRVEYNRESIRKAVYDIHVLQLLLTDLFEFPVFFYSGLCICQIG